VVFPIHLPALRQRKEDIPSLVEHFVLQVCAQNGWKIAEFAPTALTALKTYAWPGNIRELRNVVERLLLLAEGTIDGPAVEQALPRTNTIGSAETFGNMDGPLAKRVLEFERATVLAELERNHRHITNTAKALGLERSHLYKKCQQLGIDLRTD